MAMRRPASQLNNEDFPTLGRPTIATTGTPTFHLQPTRLGHWVFLLYLQVPPLRKPAVVSGSPPAPESRIPTMLFARPIRSLTAVVLVLGASVCLFPASPAADPK